MTPQFDPHREGAVDRRSFLKAAGFTFAGTLFAGCQESAVERAIPFLVKPEEVTPGVATLYATTCGGCGAGCGMLARNRDGRPIKLEGNPPHPLSAGGLCAVGQASLMSLYDSHRLSGPRADGKEAPWSTIDAAVIRELDALRKADGKVRILTGTVTSPTTQEMIRRFLSTFRNGRHVVYDALSCSAILDAHEQTHGARVLPRYRFENAEVIVGIDADFLGTWISPVEYTSGYRTGRTLIADAPRFSYHAQLESRLSLTGTNADLRIVLPPAGLREAVGLLAVDLSKRAGVQPPDASGFPFDRHAAALADRLWSARGKSLVVSGINDTATQILINSINHLLGNYGATVDIDRPSYQRQGNDRELQALLDELSSGSVDALFIQGSNPAYDLPVEGIQEQLRKVPLLVSFAERIDETAATARFVCPEPHALERWEDTEAVAGIVSLTQPVLRPFGDTRTMCESLAAWMGTARSAYDLVREVWERTVFTRQSGVKEFRNFWDQALLEGWKQVESARTLTRAFSPKAVSLRPPADEQPGNDGAFALVLYPTITMLDGRHAHNPWLQELPDPVTKTVWDNTVSLSPRTAGRLGVAEEDLLLIRAGTRSVELPVHIQPGQDEGVLAAALGYGRAGTDRFRNIGPRWIEAEPTVPEGGLVGRNMAGFLSMRHGTMQYDAALVTVERTGRRSALAFTQLQDELEIPDLLRGGIGERRPIIQETTYAAWKDDPSSGAFPKHEPASLWPDEHPYDGNRWGMVIDLSACTGCAACVVACDIENNIPLVGKDEVRRNRTMNWLRIDRYFMETEGQVTAAHQPMMCQHCGNAPCETVCPVLATVHSEDGLNQQVYNRCVGTRYCSNNCPYKVRRFNWFDYVRGDERQRLALNPDVVVRERGIMEKCSFCVQRIQEARIAAKNAGRALADGDVRPACQQSCPARAIVFGDMNDPKSALATLRRDPRHYRALEDTGVQPSVGYLTRVRNREEGADANG